MEAQLEGGGRETAGGLWKRGAEGDGEEVQGEDERHFPTGGQSSDSIYSECLIIFFNVDCLEM